MVQNYTLEVIKQNFAKLMFLFCYMKEALFSKTLVQFEIIVSKRDTIIKLLSLSLSLSLLFCCHTVNIFGEKDLLNKKSYLCCLNTHVIQKLYKLWNCEGGFVSAPVTGTNHRKTISSIHRKHNMSLGKTVMF